MIEIYQWFIFSRNLLSTEFYINQNNDSIITDLLKKSVSLLFTVQCTLYTGQCTLYTVQCALFTEQYTSCVVYTVQCIIYIVHYTLYRKHSAQCTQYIIQCTLYNCTFFNVYLYCIYQPVYTAFYCV